MLGALVPPSSRGTGLFPFLLRTLQLCSAPPPQHPALPDGPSSCPMLRPPNSTAWPGLWVTLHCGQCRDMGWAETHPRHSLDTPVIRCSLKALIRGEEGSWGLQAEWSTLLCGLCHPPGPALGILSQNPPHHSPYTHHSPGLGGPASWWTGLELILNLHILTLPSL